MMMKLRARLLPNGQWISEAKRWFDLSWKGVRVDRSVTTYGAMALGISDLPRLSIEPAGSVHYPLTWHKSEAGALTTINEVKSLLGDHP